MAKRSCICSVKLLLFNCIKLEQALPGKEIMLNKWYLRSALHRKINSSSPFPHNCFEHILWLTAECFSDLLSISDRYDGNTRSVVGRYPSSLFQPCPFTLAPHLPSHRCVMLCNGFNTNCFLWQSKRMFIHWIGIASGTLLKCVWLFLSLFH